MVKNDFFEVFSNAFQNDMTQKDSVEYHRYCGNPYELNEKTVSNYMTIVSGGTLCAVYPYHYINMGLPYYCIFYTESGAGSIRIDDKIYTLGKNTILLLQKNQSYHVDLTMAPWTYSVFFVQGDLFSSYISLFTQDTFFFHKLHEYSTIPQHIKSLSKNAEGNSLFAKLSDVNLLTQIFTELYDEIRPKENSRIIPSYLQEMYELINQSYADSFLLDDFEAHFNISKYRLCREFTKYYGEAPLTYLNHKRIQVAKELLVSSDLKIYEIGIAVGIENTNHFIHLFKKNTGVTPLYYKKHYNC